MFVEDVSKLQSNKQTCNYKELLVPCNVMFSRHFRGILRKQRQSLYSNSDRENFKIFKWLSSFKWSFQQGTKCLFLTELNFALEYFSCGLKFARFKFAHQDLIYSHGRKLAHLNLLIGIRCAQDKSMCRLCGSSIVLAVAFIDSILKEKAQWLKLLVRIWDWRPTWMTARPPLIHAAKTFFAEGYSWKLYLESRGFLQTC